MSKQLNSIVDVIIDMSRPTLTDVVAAIDELLLSRDDHHAVERGPESWSWADAATRRSFTIAPSPHDPTHYLLTIKQELSGPMHANLVTSSLLLGNSIAELKDAFTNMVVMSTGAYIGLNNVISSMIDGGIAQGLKQCADMSEVALDPDQHSIISAIADGALKKSGGGDGGVN